MTNKAINILIIDDHRLVADGLGLILSRLSNTVNITTLYSVRSALSDLVMLKQQSLILVDLNMPAMDGLSFLQSLSNRRVTVPVVVVSAVENRTEIKKVLQCGARGFIPKELSAAQMLEGVKRVLSGERYLPDHLAELLQVKTMSQQQIARNAETGMRISAESDYPQLRERQLDVLKLIQTGLSNSDIADILGVSESTVKSHVSTLFKAFGVSNRTACVKVGLESKLIDG
ncbi:response regulator [Arenicella xantha]|uniref:LuxR family two component transcriptional regulator n=1 Tax=Arenicella xantha TaxID=644221 RepID=A0A395JQY0_9GAMM|nr:response regulator transcription factor [Arenicella xantha]RBP51120.1 LuxR family two component transcriptional regulator [Arenicella xantha]